MTPNAFGYLKYDVKAATGAPLDFLASLQAEAVRRRPVHMRLHCRHGTGFGSLNWWCVAACQNGVATSGLCKSPRAAVTICGWALEDLADAILPATT